MKKKIHALLVTIARKNRILRETYISVKTFIQKQNYLRYSRKYKVDDKLCVFEAFNGRKYCDSPKAIYLRMLNDKKYKDYKFIWAFIKPEDFKELEKNRNTTLVEYHSKEYKKAYARAKYFFTPSRLPDYIIPKKDQNYVQCWHGTPLKRLGFDIKVGGVNALHTVKDWQHLYEYDATRYSYMVSPSRFVTDVYISAFNLKHINKDKCILETGYPRNDALFTFDDKYVNKLKKDLNIPKDKKIILYAPTWRDNQHTSGVGYTYKVDVDFDLLQKELGNEYIILFRAHYFVANSFDFEKYKGFIYDVSHYESINDLYVIADMLITDYSSVFFDYAILKRPIIFYMYDLKAYQEDIRGFYIDLKELPGNIVENEKDLIIEINNMKNNFKYDERYQKFHDKFNSLEDGEATKRVLKKIMEK